MVGKAFLEVLFLLCSRSFSGHFELNLLCQIRTVYKQPSATSLFFLFQIILLHINSSYRDGRQKPWHREVYCLYRVQV